MQKLLRRFHHHPPRGLEAGDFMDAPLRSAAESQFRVRHADPSAMLPATHASPPAHEIQGGLGALSTGHVAAEAPEPSANFALDLGKKYVSGLESWQQHPHWGLTSATGLEDVLPRALGHRQCREYLCADGVDSDGAVQLVFGQPALESYCEALGNFSSIWTQYVEAHNTLTVFDIADYFCITFVVIS